MRICFMCSTNEDHVCLFCINIYYIYKTKSLELSHLNCILRKTRNVTFCRGKRTFTA